jgi:hypothetical protein
MRRFRVRLRPSIVVRRVALRGSLLLCAMVGLGVIGGFGDPVGAAASASDATHVYNVLSYGYSAADDTSAFKAAITAASADATGYPAGPTGASQGVVYVPAGVYRVLNVKLKPNVRLEVDAGAELMQAGGPTAKPARLFILDGPATAALRNVSIVGVGSSAIAGDHAKPMPASGWDVSRDFTLNLDPAATNSSPSVRGVDVRNVDGFVISHVLIFQNKSTTSGQAPDSQKAAIGLTSDSFSPLGGPYYDPHNGIISDIYALNGPGGYGPDQVDSAHNVAITNVYSDGGTALRLETQASKGQYGAMINGLTASTITCDHGNRAVSFSPHAQANRNVTVSGVTATDCNQAVKVSGYLEPGLTTPGYFQNSSVDGVTATSGTTAQLTITGAWTLGQSDRAIAIDPAATYQVAITNLTCTGTFQHASNISC